MAISGWEGDSYLYTQSQALPENPEAELQALKSLSQSGTMDGHDKLPAHLNCLLR